MADDTPSGSPNRYTAILKTKSWSHYRSHKSDRYKIYVCRLGHKTPLESTGTACACTVAMAQGQLKRD